MDLMLARTGSEVAIEYLFRMSGGVQWSAWVSLQGAFQDVWSSSSCDRNLGSSYVLLCMQRYYIKTPGASPDFETTVAVEVLVA